MTEVVASLPAMVLTLTGSLAELQGDTGGNRRNMSSVRTVLTRQQPEKSIELTLLINNSHSLPLTAHQQPGEDWRLVASRGDLEVLEDVPSLPPSLYSLPSQVHVQTCRQVVRRWGDTGY